MSAWSSAHVLLSAFGGKQATRAGSRAGRPRTVRGMPPCRFSVKAPTPCAT